MDNVMEEGCTCSCHTGDLHIGIFAKFFLCCPCKDKSKDKSRWDAATRRTETPKRILDWIDNNI